MRLFFIFWSMITCSSLAAVNYVHTFQNETPYRLNVVLRCADTTQLQFYINPHEIYKKNVLSIPITLIYVTASNQSKADSLITDPNQMKANNTFIITEEKSQLKINWYKINKGDA